MTKSLKIAYVGHLSKPSDLIGVGGSVAGNQVQQKIYGEIQNKFDSVTVYAMESMPIWPRGPFYSSSSISENVAFIGFLNLPVLKHFVFSFRLFIFLLFYRPNVILQYNSYFFENISIIALSKLLSGCKIVSIVQDVHISSLNGSFAWMKRGLKYALEYLSIKLLRRFDLVVAISQSIIDDFELDDQKSFVFQGGVTDFANYLLSLNPSLQLDNIAVYAGALEPHNGVDVLVNKWISLTTDVDLHIFGRGSLESLVREVASRNPKVIFHGYRSEDVISEWQSRAMLNVCLRFSIGLDERYFFPSKFFNVCCAPGLVLCNKFNNIPDKLFSELLVVDNELSKLQDILDSVPRINTVKVCGDRRLVLLQCHQWKSCVESIFQLI